MAKSVKVALELDTRSFQQGIRQSENALDGFENKGKNVTSGLSNAFKALAGAVAIKEIIDFGDAATGLQNRLRAVTDNAAETAAAFDLVRGVANNTRSDIGAVADLFTNITVATADMGLGMQQVADITKTFSQTLKISGADTASASGAIRQFGQALASGVLRGDEFNSIMEANPVFMRAMAEAIGQPIGALRELAADGALTADIIVAATNEMAGTMDERFGTTVPTIGESFQVLKNEVIAFFTELENQTHIFENVAKGVSILTANLDILAGIMAGVFAAAAVGRIVAVVNSIIALSNAMKAATASAVLLQSITGVGLLKVAAGATAAAVTIGAMNSLLEETNEVTVEGMGITEESDAAEGQRENNRQERSAAELARIQAENEAKKKADEEAAKEAERQAEREAAAELRRQENHAKELLRAQERIAQAEIDLEYMMRDLELMSERIGLTDVEIAQLENTNELNREREEKLAEIAKYNITDEEKNQLQAELNALYDENIAKINEKIRATDEEQKLFSTGWKNAWADYKDAAEDNSKLAGDLFNTVTKGMEDAFVDFVMTGKTSFKDLIDDMIKQLLRIVAKKIFVAIIDVLTGGLGSVFEGFFDSGGYIGAGKLGIVGERGPELVQGPARVIGRQQTSEMSLGGGNQAQVNYTIYANDAKSFREMIARDKEFIYNVTVAGARSLPR